MRYVLSVFLAVLLASSLTAAPAAAQSVEISAAAATPQDKDKDQSYDYGVNVDVTYVDVARWGTISPVLAVHYHTIHADGGVRDKDEGVSLGARITRGNLYAQATVGLKAARITTSDALDGDLIGAAAIGYTFGRLSIQGAYNLSEQFGNGLSASVAARLF